MKPSIDQRYFSSFEELASAGFQIKSEEPINAEMPNPEAAFCMVQGIMSEIFDLFRSTRLEANGERLAWGIVNAFHRQAEQLTKAEDQAAQAIQTLVQEEDTSEIGSTRLEEAQQHVKSLEEARAAFECMTDHAAQLYSAETGRPWQPFAGSRVGKASASIIDAKDYLAARAADKRAKYHPQGPVVLFSGGNDWGTHAQIYAALDDVKTRIPQMVLVTTAQRSGADAIAAAWAASQKVTVIAYGLPKGLGKKAGFVRIDRMIGLKPVHAIIAQGSGLQINMSQKITAAGIPKTVLRHDPDHKPATKNKSATPSETDTHNPFARAA